jgi:branched-chain amino acid transport system substrate-binding protein
MKLKNIAAACGLTCAMALGTSAHAQISGDVIRIGIITDMSGLYSDIDGQAGVEAIKMAVADMGGAMAKKLKWCLPTTKTRPMWLLARLVSGSIPRV